MQPLGSAEIKELLGLLQAGMDVPEAQRDAWLAQLRPTHSGLKPTIAQLLRKQAQFETDDFIDELARHTRSEPQEDVSLAPAPFIGAIVGPYRLLSPIGEGGMSSVWLAERDDGILKRKVALKLPHWWALSKLTTRAVQERDILASLEHPNIARLYDAGITPDGRPYLALEYIEGQPIDAFCRTRAVDLHTRVQLIVQIARAVAYAHSRLIVHRDLKPSNILIDAQEQVHLLDFGIAKLIEEGSASNKALTQAGVRLLTREYASPEQIVGNPVTTASDVYSLGMVAYELFAGRPPYTFDGSGRTEWEVIDGEILAPSALASEDARALRGDLDTIVLKALKREPIERYATAAAFAEDLERYLRGDPVLAQPDSAGYRLRKFAARNRLAVGATAAVVIALATGLAIASWQLRIARQEKQRAEEVKGFVASIFRSADPFFTGNRDMSAAQLLTLAKERIDREMTSQPDNAAELLLIVGEAQSNLEQLQEANATLLAALKTAEGTLPADSLQVAAGRAKLANVQFQLGDYEAVDRQLALAIPILERYREEREGARALVNALATRGYIAGEKGDKERAIADMKYAVEIARATLGENDSETILAMRQLAQEHLLVGEVPEGLEAARIAYEAAHKHFGQGGRNNLLIEAEDVYGRALADSGQVEQGIAHLRSAIDAAEKLLGPQTDSVTSKLSWLARAQMKLGDVNGAIATLERCVNGSQNELSKARVSTSYGLALLTARRTDEAIQVLKKSATDLQRIDETGGPWVVNALSTYGNALAMGGRTDEARRVLEPNITNNVSGPALPDSHNGLGTVALSRKDLAAAKRHFEQALELTAAGAASRVTVSALLGLGTAQLESGQLQEAEASLLKAESTQATLVQQPTPVLIDIIVARGRVALEQKQHETAIALFKEADAYWQSFAPQNPRAIDAARWKQRAMEAHKRSAASP